MTFYYLNSTPLSPGSIIEAGNWGRIVRHFGSSHGRCIQEAILEDIRLNGYPKLPSRLECSYFFDDLGEARFYKNIDQGRGAMILYEVDILDPTATIHRTDWRNVGHDGSLSLGWARRYWAGTFLPTHESGYRCEELLAITDLKIVARLPY